MLFYRLALLALLFSMVSLAHRRVAGDHRASARTAACRRRAPLTPRPTTDRDAHTGPGLALVDVRRDIAPADVPGLLRLGMDEHVHAVDDQLVTDDTMARYLIRESAGKFGADHRYIDVTIDGPHSERRILVLAH